MTRQQFLWNIEKELQRAYDKHGREQWTRHEFYAIVKEELDEVWDDIKADAPEEKLTKEIIQVAAMCLRYLETGRRYPGREYEPEKPAFLRKVMD